MCHKVEGEGKHGFRKGNCLCDGIQFGQPKSFLSNSKCTPRRIVAVFPGQGWHSDCHDSALNTEKGDEGRIEE